jgi:hypothetical protein
MHHDRIHQHSRHILQGLLLEIGDSLYVRLPDRSQWEDQSRRSDFLEISRQTEINAQRVVPERTGSAVDEYHYAAHEKEIL